MNRGIGILCVLLAIGVEAGGEPRSRVGLDQIFYSDGTSVSSVSAATELSRRTSGEIEFGFGSVPPANGPSVPSTKSFFGRLGLTSDLSTLLSTQVGAAAQGGEDGLFSFGGEMLSTWWLNSLWSGRLPTQILLGAAANRIGTAEGEYSWLFSGTVGLSQHLSPSLALTATFTSFAYGDRYGVTSALDDLRLSAKDDLILRALDGFPRNIWSAAAALKVSASLDFRAIVSSVLAASSPDRIPDAELRASVLDPHGYVLGLRAGVGSRGIFRLGFSLGYEW